MTEEEMKYCLFKLYETCVEVCSTECYQMLNAYQNVATAFGWIDVLENMRKLAREKLLWHVKKLNYHQQ